MNTQTRHSDVLVCIPCYNSETTIVQTVEPLLRFTDADLLLVDDLSTEPLRDYIQHRFPRDMDRITVFRADRKVYCGGAKNIGMRKALDEGYRIAIMMDSDIVVPGTFIARIKEFFQENPHEVIVAPAILPSGGWCQYADTLINFSWFLPEPSRDVSRRTCLAGYTFALNMDIFRERPCFHHARYGGEDVLFSRVIAKRFGLDGLPVLNQLRVVHQPPRSSLRQAVAAQKRYGRAFFTHADRRREYLFRRIPMLHLFTPRFGLMLARLLRRRRYCDLVYSPLCWWLDFVRAIQILRLTWIGYRDPSYTTVSKGPRNNRRGNWLA